MRIQTVSVLTIFLIFVPVLEAQRGGGARQGGGARTAGPPPRALPSTPVMPMTNPVGSMTNPIAPVIPYGGAATGLGTSPRLPNRPVNLPARIPDRRRDVIIASPFVGPFFPSVFDYTYYDPYLRPPTIPGQLPGVYPLPPEPDYSVAPNPVTEIAPAPREPEPIFYPESRMIITLPEPGREPPAIGTSRADVLARYGEPWGSLTIRGQETLYFRGDLKVVLKDGKVTQVQVP